MVEEPGIEVAESVGQPEGARERFEPGAMVLGIVLPGAGHVLVGESKRGLLVAAGVLGLFVGGLLIGGISVVDSREQRIWYVGQVMVGPIAYAVDRVHQGLKVRDPDTGRLVAPSPGNRPAYEPSLGRMHELGTLYCAIAGMMNLIAVLDVTFHRGRRDARGTGVGS